MTEGLSPADAQKMFEIVQDPRYSQEKYIKGLPLVANLKIQILQRGLVSELNRRKGWNLSNDGNWSVKQTSDLMYDVVLAPGYELEKFIASIQSK